MATVGRGLTAAVAAAAVVLTVSPQIVQALECPAQSGRSCSMPILSSCSFVRRSGSPAKSRTCSGCACATFAHDSLAVRFVGQAVPLGESHVQMMSSPMLATDEVSSTSLCPHLAQWPKHRCTQAPIWAHALRLRSHLATRLRPEGPAGVGRCLSR
jgi:hypothetical protein